MNANKFIVAESKKTLRALDKLGAASTERLASVTGLPLIAVGYALARAEERGQVKYTKSELWTVTDAWVGAL